MIMEKLRLIIGLLALLIGMFSIWGIAFAQTNTTTKASEKAENKREAAAITHVKEAVNVLQQVKSEHRMAAVLQQAKGLFIMPTYARFAVGLGGIGGVGVLVAKLENGTWSDPAFYNVGGINLGAQVGMELGAIVLVLKNEKALTSMMKKNAFSLNAEAGLTIEDWSKMAESSIGTGDIIVWSGAKGLFANAVSVGVKDIVFDHRLNHAYYHLETTAQEIIQGKIHNNQVVLLRDALRFLEHVTDKGVNP